MDISFGSHLRLLRDSSGLKQTELAEILNVNINTVGGYERDERIPDVDFLIKFSEVVGANLVDLIRLRMLKSPAYDENPKSKIQNFLHHLNRDDIIAEMGIKARLWKESQNKITSGNTGTRFELVSKTNTSPNFEINKNLFINCLHACNEVYKEKFITMSVNDAFNLLVDVYNLICKLTSAIDDHIDNASHLTVKDIEKQVEVFRAMGKLPL